MPTLLASSVILVIVARNSPVVGKLLKFQHSNAHFFLTVTHVLRCSTILNTVLQTASID